MVHMDIDTAIRRRNGARREQKLDKLLLKPEEAAALLSIGRSKVYELMSDGRLASVRIDASRRVPFSALVEFVDQLQGQRVEAPTK